MVSATVRAACANDRLGSRRVAQLGLEGEIAWPVGPHLRRTPGERGHGADHMRQRLPVDRDCLGGVFRRGEAVGDHEGDGVADVPHHVLGKDRIDRDLNLGSGDHPGRRQRSEFRHVRSSEHQPQARHSARAVEIVDGEAGMRMRRAQHHRVQRGRGRKICHVTPGAAQQRVVLLARECLPESEFHRHRSAGRACCRRRAKRSANQRETT